MILADFRLFRLEVLLLKPQILVNVRKAIACTKHSIKNTISDKCGLHQHFPLSLPALEP
jgi:hypothetical protein